MIRGLVEACFRRVEYVLVSWNLSSDRWLVNLYLVADYADILAETSTIRRRAFVGLRRAYHLIVAIIVNVDSSNTEHVVITRASNHISE